MSGSIDIYLTEELKKGAARAQERDVCFLSFTHDYVPLWQNAGIYEQLYFSDGKKAETITHALSQAMIFFHKYGQMYIEKYPSLDIRGAINQIDHLLFECEAYPNAIIHVRK